MFLFKAPLLSVTCSFCLILAGCGGSSGSGGNDQPQGNSPPQANAGEDLSVDEATLVELTGQDSDTDGEIVARRWEQLSGTPVEITNDDQTSAEFTAPTLFAGEVLVFRYQVTDNDDATTSDTIRITVSPVNDAPQALAGDDQSVNEGSLVTLVGEDSDTDGEIIIRNWEQVSGATVEITNSDQASASFTAPELTATEILAFRYQVTDNENAIASDTILVTVSQVNELPIANAGENQTVNEGSTVTLTGQDSDIDGEILVRSWEQTSGTEVEIINSDNASAEFTAPTLTAGEILAFRYQVTDDENATAFDSVLVTVNPVNALPQAAAGENQTTDEELVVTLVGEDSDTDGEIATRSWEQVSGTAVDLINNDQSSAEFTAPKLTETENLVFRYEVTDNEGAAASDTVRVTVNPVNTAPEANAGEDQFVNEETSVTLAGQDSDTDGDIVTRSWEQVSGTAVTIVNGDKASAEFTAPTLIETEILEFRYEVIDNENATVSDTILVTVNPVNTPPEVDAGENAAVNEETEVFLTASVRDEDGEIIESHWRQVSGPLVKLIEDGDFQSKFFAPNVINEEELLFEISAVDSDGVEATDQVVITVQPAFDVKAIFPPEVGAFSGSAIDVSGRVESFDSGMTVTVRVLTDAYDEEVTPDENGDWRLTDVPITSVDGLATISVTAEQGDSSDSYEIVLDTLPEIFHSQGIAVDPDTHDIYYYSKSNPSVVKVDSETGGRSVLFTKEDLSLLPVIISKMVPAFGVGSPAQDYLYFLTTGSRVVEINLDTQEATTVVESNNRGWEHMAVDGNALSVYLINEQTLVEIDIETGDSKVLASDEVGDGPLFESPQALLLLDDALWVVDETLDELIRIDRSSLERTIVSGEKNDINFCACDYEAVVDPTSNRIILTSQNGVGVSAIDVTTGERSQITTAGAGFAPQGDIPSFIDLSPNEGKLVGLFDRSGYIGEISLEESSVTLISQERSLSDEAFSGTTQIKYLNSDESIYVSNSFVVNEQLPSMQSITASGTNHESWFFQKDQQILDFVHETSTTILYHSCCSLMRFDLSSDTHELVSDVTRGDGPSINSFSGMAYDSARNIVYLHNEGQTGSGYSILEIDVETGNRQTVFDEPEADETPVLSSLGQIDSFGNLLLIQEGDPMILYQLDTTNWEKSLFVETDLLSEADFYSEEEDALYRLSDGGVFSQPGIERLNLNTMEVSTVSNHETGEGPIMILPDEIAPDLDNNRAFVSEIGRVFSVDLISGDRVIMLRNAPESE